MNLLFDSYLFWNPGIGIIKTKFDKAVDAVNSGVNETKVACKVLIIGLAPVGLLGIYISAMMEQWLIEEKFSEKEILMLSCDVLAGGLDTVNECAIWE